MRGGRRLLLSLLAASCAVSHAPPNPPLDASADGSNDSGMGAEIAPACTGSGGGSAWANWPMPDPTTPSSESYDASSPGIVGDQITHLMWQRDLDTSSYDWLAAKAYCDCLLLAEYDDWRLPTRIELVSIVDFTRPSPAIDTGAFPEAPGDYFWTSSPLAGSTSAAWYVYFFDGNTHSIGVDSRYRVRCVRGAAPAPARRFTVAGDGTVIDGATGLTWQREIDPTARSWNDAKAYCADLSLAGTGWRLPNMKELQTLIDESKTSPAIDTTAFPDTPDGAFWTSSPLADTLPEAWFVNFYSGVAYTNVVADLYRARCVR